MTTVEQAHELTRIDGLLDALRAAEAEFRRSYSRVLEVVAELDAEKAGTIAGFGTTARLLAGVLNLSKSEARTRAKQAELLTARRSLIGETLPPALPATAAELAAGRIGPAHVRVITATVRRLPPTTHPDVTGQAEQTLAHAAQRFDPTALARIGERLLAHLDPDGSEPAEEPETLRELRVRTRPDGTVSLAGQLDPEGGARVLEVLGSHNQRRSPIDGLPDTRTAARRDADAMTRLLDEGELPTRSGRRPHLVLTMGLAELVTGLGAATLDTGGQLTAAEARRLACDAGIIPMVLGGDSMPLDVGRQQRLATAALRDALGQRDKGCSFPGCERPSRYCHAHHIVPWLDGGETKLDNLCLLCEYHHIIVHRQHWHIRLDGRGRPEFTPPPAIDPTRTPLHNPLRQ
ncbi:MAG: DUF222 domain-containing protein [Pseudonocardiaceae bacterium]